MAGIPPGVPPVPPPYPPPGYDPRAYGRAMREQARAQRAAFRAQRMQMRYQMRGLRRGSVLGPLLLIGLGVLFLLFQTGRLDHQRFWDWYSSWWPLLLVAGGAVLLAEWAFDQFNLRDPQHPRYRRSLGGGAVVLILFICMAGFVARHIHNGGEEFLRHGFVLNEDNFDQFFGDKHESDQALDFGFPPTGTLVVVNPRGDVTVSGTSDDNRIHLAIHKQVYASSDSEAGSRAQQLTPTTENNGSTVTITMPSLDGARADLVLTVPPAAATLVTANRGDIRINSIKAPVTATANRGDIELSAITGAATAHLNSAGSSISAHSMGSGIAIEGHGQDVTLSDITGQVTIDGEIFGSTHMEHLTGPIRYHTSRTDFQLGRLDGQVDISPHSDLSADQAMGPLVLSTSNHNISLERIAGDISVTNRNGTIDLTAASPLGNITLQNRNGSVRTTMPDHTGFVVQATTTDGDIDNDLQLEPLESGSKTNLNGTIGAGGPRLSITTTNGDVSVHKGDVLAMPPSPPAPPKLTLAPPAPPAPAPSAKKSHN